MSNGAILVGYSGHSYVVYDILNANQISCYQYCEEAEKNRNPFNLTYLGSEFDNDILSQNRDSDFYLAVGNNVIRSKIYQHLSRLDINMPSLVHPCSIISKFCSIDYGSVIMPGVVINPASKIGKGVICNTSSVIEHEASIGDFVHIAPGAVLAGNVAIGKNSFIGANSVIKQGVQIGTNVTVGAGSVIIENVPDNSLVYGNPGKLKL
ncbi:acetyltransferase [Daejeonella sp.]|uniref:acetyltransferase n=1 Tax=Daejeonella sp. TaxID=2805397 RepID=UPI0030BE4AFA